MPRRADIASILIIGTRRVAPSVPPHNQAEASYVQAL
jgi:hypothetical protein